MVFTARYGRKSSRTHVSISAKSKIRTMHVAMRLPIAVRSIKSVECARLSLRKTAPIVDIDRSGNRISARVRLLYMIRKPTG